MSHSASALTVALEAAGVTIDVRSNVVYLNPKSAVTEAILVALRRFKPELVNAFNRCARERIRPDLIACRRCDAEFATRTVGLCQFCKVTEGQSVSAGSCHESRYLFDESARRATVQTVQNVDKTTHSGQLDSLDSSRGKSHTHAHAKGITGTAVQTVQPSKSQEAA